MSDFLPSGWILTTLGDAFEWGSGGTPKSTEPSYYGGEIPWAIIGDLHDSLVTYTDGSITELGLQKSSAKWVEKGSILLAMYGSIGKLGIAGTRLTTNQAIAFTQPGQIEGKYLFYYLWSKRNDLSSLGKGGTQKNISQTVIKSFPIPLAPLPEQRRIVEAIETQLTRLDAAVAALKRAQANLKRYRASVLKAAVEGRLVPTEAELARRESREFEVGEELLARSSVKRACIEIVDQLPEGWAASLLGSLAKVGTGATPLRSKLEYYDSGTIPWVTSGSVNETTISEPSGYVTELALKETNLTIYPPHTLLIAMYGEGKTRGKCSELLISATTNQALAALVFAPETEVLRPFVKIFLDSNYEAMRRAASGGVQPNLNLAIIKQVSVPIPPLAEQHRIVSEFSRQMSLIEKQSEVLDRILKHAEIVRQSVLKQAFEGKLVPQDPSDESASVLLGRIRATRSSLTAPTRKQNKLAQERLPL